MTLYAGDSLILDYVVLDDAGNAMDLTGKTLRWGLSLPRAAPATMLTKALGAGLEITDAGGGRCQVTIDKGDVAAPGAYTAELEASDGTWSKTVSRMQLIFKPALFTD